MFLMYAEIIFLYYFNDMKGCVLTGLAFCLITMAGSMVSTHFTEIWYGAGLVAGSFAGWTTAYMQASVDGEASGYPYILQWTFAEKEKRRLSVTESI